MNNISFSEFERLLDLHDKSIIREFAMWLDNHGYMRKMDINISRVDEALYEYEKEQKK